MDEEKLTANELDIEKEINTLENAIEGFEKTDFNFMNDRIRRLQHHTLYVHQKVELFLGGVISVDLMMDQSKLLSQDDALKIFLKMKGIFEATDFFRLLAIANRSKLLPKGFYDIATKVNNLRIIFAHPASNQKELINLQKVSSRLKAYKDLKKAYDLMNKHVIKKQKERDELVERLANKKISLIASRIKTEGTKNIGKIVKEELDNRL